MDIDLYVDLAGISDEQRKILSPVFKQSGHVSSISKLTDHELVLQGVSEEWLPKIIAKAQEIGLNIDQLEDWDVMAESGEHHMNFDQGYKVSTMEASIES